MSAKRQLVTLGLARRGESSSFAAGKMSDDWQREVWEMVDRDHLARVAHQGPEPIFATISGAHLYGQCRSVSAEGIEII